MDDASFAIIVAVCVFIVGCISFYVSENFLN